MASTLFYLLQVTVCSAVLFGYYLLVLRNKRFHQYNRFYLLSILFISWLVPLIRLPWQAANTDKGFSYAPLQMFDVIADGNATLETFIVQTGRSLVNWNSLAIGVYLSVSAVLLLLVVQRVVRILWLVKQHGYTRINGTAVVITNDEAAPFSFFRYIFWNHQIDINSNVGRQILQHEMAHVQQKHSLDKIATALVLVVGWLNPVFWLVRRELDMVHEFIADQKAVDNNPAALAQMLLTATCPSFSYPLTNAFFHSPIKRRLFMMNPFNAGRFSYLRRLLILPLLGMVIMLFAFRKQITALHETQLNREYIVMIDAGHGGHDRGASAGDGTSEADLTLELVKTIAAENRNPNIRLVFTRESDVYQHPQLKAELTHQSNADLLVSVHVAASENPNTKGVELYVPTKDTFPHYKASFNFANVLANSLLAVDKNVQIKSRQVGIWIINTAARPAVLIEAGFLSNAENLQRLKDKEQQRKLASAILIGIERYLFELEKTVN